MASTKVWVGGTAVVSVALLGGTWFLAVAPTLTAAAETRTQADAAEQQNDALRDKIAQLEVDFDNLPALEQELTDLRVGIPTTLELADYLRELDSLAAASSITLLDVRFEDAQTVPVAAAPAPAAPEPSATATAGTDGTDAGTSTAGEDAAAGEAGSAAPAAVDGFVAVPVTFTALGSFPNALSFLTAVQVGTQRVFLPGTVTIEGQGAEAASGGRPETVEGDAELKITGYIYVLEDPTATPAPGPTGPLPELGEQNPVVPGA